MAGVGKLLFIENLEKNNQQNFCTELFFCEPGTGHLHLAMSFRLSVRP